MISVEVRFTSGCFVADLTLSDNMPIIDLKQRLAKVSSLAPNEQQLLFGDQVLENSSTIKDACISSGALLCLCTTVC